MGKLINIKSIDMASDMENKSVHGTTGDLQSIDSEEVVCSAAGNIKEKGNRYWKTTSSGEKIISNFVINPIELVKGINETTLRVQLLTAKGKVYEELLEISAFSSSSRFKSFICSRYIDLMFKGRDDDLEEIKEIMCSKGYKVKKGVGYTGILNKDGKFIFVSPRASIDENGSEYDDITYAEASTGNNDEGNYSDNHCLIQTDIIEQEPIWEPDLQKISKALFNYNELQTTATIIGFCASCFLKERLYLANGTKFNHLVLSGESGSGKSEIVETVIMPIFSTKSSTEASQCTKFVSIKIPSSSNTIPFIISEYKPGDDKIEKINISELMRNSYDRTASFRGRSDQKMNMYPSLAPIVLSGEVIIEEPALLERSLVVCFAKSKIEDKSRFESFQLLKDNKKVLKSLGRSLLEEALKLDTSVLIERQRTLDSRIGDSIPSRNKNAVINCMLGILLLEDVYKSMCFDVKECTGYSIDELFQAIIDAMKENVFDGKNQVDGVIENSLEVLNDMAELGFVKGGRDFQVINSGEELALDVKQFYANYLSYIKSHNMVEIDKLTEKNYKKQLSLKDYCIDNNRTVVFNNNMEVKRKKAFVLSIPKLNQRQLNLSNLCN